MLNRLVLFFCLIISSKVLADDCSHNEVIDWFVKQASSSIRYVEKDRIYLNASKVSLSNEHIFLMNDFNEIIPLPSIFSSKEGLYIRTDQFGILDEIVNIIHDLNLFNTWICSNPFCERLNSGFVNVCRYCGTLRGEPSQEKQGEE